MKITESRLRRLISEEIAQTLDQSRGSSEEDVLTALEILSEANPTILRKEISVLEELLLRAKNS